MSNSDIVLEYLKRIAPRPATNAQISSATGVKPHAQVFQITAKLEKADAIKGRLFDKEWEYWFEPNLIPVTTPVSTSSYSDALAFEVTARKKLEQFYGVKLPRGTVPNIPKNWDFCSFDRSVVGDAKYFAMVNGERNPPAKMSVIAEYVWLLSKTDAKTKFFAFGNDRRVIEVWLQKHRHLAADIKFWFLANTGTLRASLASRGRNVHRKHSLRSRSWCERRIRISRWLGTNECHQTRIAF